MIHFFAPDIQSNPTLPEGESLHCAKVLRLNAGDHIEVVDGKGHIFSCVIMDAHHKHTLVQITDRRDMPLSWNYNLTVAVAPAKHLDRMEWLTEKITEIGINQLIPALCDRSERREIKIERLQKIAVSAMKQSLKAVLPEITPMTPIKRIIQECNAPDRFICYCDKNIERRLLAREITPGNDACILIGPEGDFTPEEINLALSHGFTPVTLGDNRLRTETAALYAASTIHVINQFHQPL